MGSWNETCMLSHLPICYGQKAVVIILADYADTCHKNQNVSVGRAFRPIMFPFIGTYNGYGSLTDAYNMLADGEHIAKYYEFQTKSDGVFTTVKPLNETISDIKKFISDVNQGNLYCSSKIDLSHHRKLHVEFMHADLFFKLIEFGMKNLNVYVNDDCNNINSTKYVSFYEKTKNGLLKYFNWLQASDIKAINKFLEREIKEKELLDGAKESAKRYEKINLLNDFKQSFVGLYLPFVEHSKTVLDELLGFEFNHIYTDIIMNLDGKVCGCGCWCNERKSCLVNVLADWSVFVELLDQGGYNFRLGTSNGHDRSIIAVQKLVADYILSKINEKDKYGEATYCKANVLDTVWGSL